MAARAQVRMTAERMRELERVKARQQEWLREQETDENFEAGPPNDCHVCYAWTRCFYDSVARWIHHDELNGLIETRPVTSPMFEYDTRICHHDCHGPDGEDLGPVIALG